MPKLRKFTDWLLFADEDYLAVAKPAYVATLDDRSGRPSVLALAAAHYPDVQVCHRLDKETSGVLLLAKHNAAYKHANSQFASRTVEKTYHAVVDGRHTFSGLEINLPLHVAPSGVVRANNKTGKPSVTVVTTVQQYKQHTLVACTPVTGRMHQIRVHLAARNAPLVADTLYGGEELYLSAIKRKYTPKAGTAERPLMPRVALHAYALKFRDLAGNEQHITCPYPKDFRTLLSQLDKNR